MGTKFVLLQSKSMQYRSINCLLLDTVFEGFECIDINITGRKEFGTVNTMFIERLSTVWNVLYPRFYCIGTIGIRELKDLIS